MPGMLRRTLPSTATELLAGGGKEAHTRHALAMISNRETVIKLIRKELGLPEDRPILPAVLFPRRKRGPEEAHAILHG